MSTASIWDQVAAGQIQAPANAAPAVSTSSSSGAASGDLWDQVERGQIGDNSSSEGNWHTYTNPQTGEVISSANPTPPGMVPGSMTSPTAGQDNFTPGFGKALVDTARGTYQLGASIAHAAGMISDEKMAQIQQQIDTSKKLDQPLMQTTGGKIGDIAGQGVQLAALGPEGIVSGALAGGALGAAQPVATGSSREENAEGGAIGGAAGGAAGKILGGVLTGFGTPEARAAAVSTLDNEGIPLTVAQRTGSKGAQTIERTSAMTSDQPAQFAAHQAQAFNAAVLRRVGVTDPNVTAATPDVLSDAKGAITDVMDDVASRNKIVLDQGLTSDIATVRNAAGRTLPDSESAPLLRNIQDIEANAQANGGALDGTFYQKLRSNLSALRQNPGTAPLAGDLQDAVDSAMARSSDPQDVAALQTARQQYRALKQIEPAVNTTNGDISPLALMRSLSVKSNRNQALYGQGDQSLMNLARAAKKVIPDTLGNSGTPERMLQPLGAMETLASGKPMAAGVKLLAGRGGLNAAGRAMRSQGMTADYLSEGVPGGEAASEIARRVGAPAGYATLGTLVGAKP